MSFLKREILLVAPEILNNRSMPCVGLGYIGAYLAKNDVRVRIIDSQFRKENPSPVIQQASPTLVGIAIESRTVDRALRIARMAKARGHVTLAGGVHVSLLKEDILRHPEIDYAITGDGESATYRLLQALDGQIPFDAVPRLIWRTPEGIRRNPNVHNSDAIDSLPPPDYGLAGVKHIDLYPLVTSRDCPYSCTFCTTGALSHGSFRGRRVEDCVEEIVQAKEKYGIRGFIVVDENFAFRMDRAYEFCELLIERKVNLPWTAFEGVRAETLNEKFLALLRRSGCRWVFFGIETVENAVLKSVRKANKFMHIQRAADMAHAHGFKVGGFLIIGLPHSSFDVDMTAVNWAMKHLDKCTFWTAIPYYGTALYQWVRQHGSLLREPVGANLINTLSTMPFFETTDYSAHDRKRAHTIANLRTGLNYFVDFLDYETRMKLPERKRTSEHAKRKLLQTVQRYDPSFLPALVPERAFPFIEDPVQMALRASAQAVSAEASMALPPDLSGPLASPVPGQSELTILS